MLLATVDLLRRQGFAQGRSPFCGTWAKRNPLGVPGPIYVGDDDACGTGPIEAPGNVVLCDLAFGEFLYRQPSSEAELNQLIAAAQVNTCDSYAIDGDEHWTVELVEAWWASMQPVRMKLRAAQRVGGLDAESQRWLDELEHRTEDHLRRYIATLRQR